MPYFHLVSKRKKKKERKKLEHRCWQSRVLCASPCTDGMEPRCGCSLLRNYGCCGPQRLFAFVQHSFVPSSVVQRPLPLAVPELLARTGCPSHVLAPRLLFCPRPTFLPGHPGIQPGLFPFQQPLPLWGFLCLLRSTVTASLWPSRPMAAFVVEALMEEGTGGGSRGERASVCLHPGFAPSFALSETPDALRRQASCPRGYLPTSLIPGKVPETRPWRLSSTFLQKGLSVLARRTGASSR